MERSVLILFFVCAIAVSVTLSSASKLGHCNDSCKHHGDCFGKLACMKGNKCNDDPDLKTHICKNSKLGHCGSSCNKHEDCRGKLACLSVSHGSHTKKCGDDPFMKTHICKKSGSAPGPKPAMGPLPAFGPFPAFGPIFYPKHPKY